MSNAVVQHPQQRYTQTKAAIEGAFRTRDGAVLQARLLRPDDADGLLELFHQLSPESRRQRFHTDVERIDQKTLITRAQQLADVDNRREDGAVLAILQGEERPQIVGVARLARPLGRPDHAEAEAAIVVRDDFHGRGVGTELLQRLVRLARRMEIEILVAVIEADNEPAIRLFRNLDLPRTVQTRRGETEMRFQIEGT